MPSRMASGAGGLYPYPPGAIRDTGLTGPTLGKIVRARFCFGGPAAALAALAPCPLTAAELNASCAASPANYFVFLNPGTSDLGPVDGVGPAVCTSPGVTATLCDPSDRAAANACFPEVDPLDALGTNVDEIVSVEGSTCVIHCFTIDGVRLCQELCFQ